MDGKGSFSALRQAKAGGTSIIQAPRRFESPPENTCKEALRLKNMPSDSA
jgi:hypothetical protein